MSNSQKLTGTQIRATARFQLKPVLAPHSYTDGRVIEERGMGSGSALDHGQICLKVAFGNGDVQDVPLEFVTLLDKNHAA